MVIQIFIQLKESKIGLLSYTVYRNKVIRLKDLNVEFFLNSTRKSKKQRVGKTGKIDIKNRHFIIYKFKTIL